MKIVRFLIILIMLLPYSLSIPTEGCGERGHLNSSHLDCGSLFHCPFVMGDGNSGTFHLPLKGRMVLIYQYPDSKLIPRSVFHPPKKVALKIEEGSEGFI